MQKYAKLVLDELVKGAKMFLAASDVVAWQQWEQCGINKGTDACPLLGSFRGIIRTSFLHHPLPAKLLKGRRHRETPKPHYVDVPRFPHSSVTTGEAPPRLLCVTCELQHLRFHFVNLVA